MTSERYERGKAFMAQWNPDAAAALARYADLAPDLERLVTTFVYGEVYSRPELDLRLRQVATISMLTTMGDSRAPLAGHVRLGLDAGLEPQELVELMIHCIPFCGLPRALSGLRVVREVLEERSLVEPAPRRTED